MVRQDRFLRRRRRVDGIWRVRVVYYLLRTAPADYSRAFRKFPAESATTRASFLSKPTNCEPRDQDSSDDDVKGSRTTRDYIVSERDTGAVTPASPTWFQYGVACERGFVAVVPAGKSGAFDGGAGRDARACDGVLHGPPSRDLGSDPRRGHGLDGGSGDCRGGRVVLGGFAGADGRGGRVVFCPLAGADDWGGAGGVGYAESHASSITSSAMTPRWLWWKTGASRTQSTGRIAGWLPIIDH